MYKVKYLRLERPKTGSWITYKLPKTMDFNERLESFIMAVMPGWEIASGCLHDPDEGVEEANF